MKKSKLIALSFIFGLLAFSFASCEKESSDSSFLKKDNVGKPEFEIKLKDSTYYRRDVTAYLGVDGTISFTIPNLGKAKKKGEVGHDIFQVSLATFTEALYPLNADGKNKNISDYLMDMEDSVDETFSSINEKSPNSGRAGLFTITNINKKASVFSGHFSISMYPGVGNTKNTERLKIEGNFKDIPFVRSGVDNNPEYMYVVAEGKIMKDFDISATTIGVTIPTVDDEGTSFTAGIIEKYTKIQSNSKVYGIFDLQIDFPESLIVGVEYQKEFLVSYVSRYGEKYTNVKNNILPGSTFKIISKEEIKEPGNKDNGKIKIKGQFEFHLKNNDNTNSTTLKQGEFVVFKAPK